MIFFFYLLGIVRTDLYAESVCTYNSAYRTKLSNCPNSAKELNNIAHSYTYCKSLFASVTWPVCILGSLVEHLSNSAPKKSLSSRVTHLLVTQSNKKHHHCWLAEKLKTLKRGKFHNYSDVSLFYPLKSHKYLICISLTPN